MVVVHYGFMQRPDIPQALRGTRKSGLVMEPESTTYYVGKESLVMGGKIPGMAIWRDRLFAFMSRNALRATDFYQIPPERTVEIGIRLHLSKLHDRP
jgi:KUP system potassium uptake protein